MADKHTQKRAIDEELSPQTTVQVERYRRRRAAGASMATSRPSQPENLSSFAAKPPRRKIAISAARPSWRIRASDCAERWKTSAAMPSCRSCRLAAGDRQHHSGPSKPPRKTPTPQAYYPASRWSGNS